MPSSKRDIDFVAAWQGTIVERAVRALSPHARNALVTILAEVLTWRVSYEKINEREGDDPGSGEDDLPF